MIMDIFVTGLCVLSLMCALIYRQSTHQGYRDPQFSKFKRTYLFVYLLATGRLSSVLSDGKLLHTNQALAEICTTRCYGLWARMGRRNRVGWGSVSAEGRCHGNQFLDAICYNWLWRFMGYNFGCMIASDTQFDSRGGFSGSSYPMKT